jgi:AraC-like DNA-binding protein
MADPGAGGTVPPEVLRSPDGRRPFDLGRWDTPAGLHPWTSHCWAVRWDTGGRTHTQDVLTAPSVHVVLEDGRVLVYGVVRRRFSRVLEGSGSVLAVAFAPGGFRPWADRPVARLTGQVLDAADVLAPPLVQRLLALAATRPDPFPGAGAGRAAGDAGDGPPPAVLALQRILLDASPAGDDPAAGTTRRVVALVEEASSRPQLYRAEELAGVAGTGLRALQRLFAEHVGVGPKWVIRRARLHEAAARASAGTHVDWAALADELGYSDQAHLVRDFSREVGMPPARYATLAAADGPSPIASGPRAAPPACP